MSRKFEKQYPGLGVVRDPIRGIMFDYGPTVPANGTRGYSPGALWIDTDGAAATNFYKNDGTLLSCLFVAVSLPGVDLSGLLATSDEINRAADVSTRLVNATGSSLAVTLASHEGKTVVLNRSAGMTIALPAATGTGGRFRFVVGTVSTTGYVFSTTPTTDTLNGVVNTLSDDSNNVIGYNSTPTGGSNSNTFTINGTTKGGASVGDIIELEDINAGNWAISAHLTASGSEVTPFSHV